MSIDVLENCFMTTTRKKLTFEKYLEYDDGTENRYELIDGELVALPPESRLNILIANFIFLKLVEAGIPLKLVYPHTCEIQVPVLQLGDPQNRYPDLVVIREAHLSLTTKRFTITLEMPPPLFVAEVVSPGKIGSDRDYNRKRAQYASIGISEYWIVDPPAQTILVLQLENDGYVEVGQFRESDPILSPTFPNLSMTVLEIFSVG
jgi:Uma2 family endonuclease